MRRSKHFWKAATVGCLALMMAIPTLSAGESVSVQSKLRKGSPNLECRSEKGKWLSGDFHQHTYYTDGSTTFDFVMEKNNEFGLDWWANSEHGGSRNRDGEGVSWLDPIKYPTNPIKGDNAASGNMWRWQSLSEYAYLDILDTRSLYPEKRIFSGLEWNVPGHEHCSTAIVPKADDNSPPQSALLNTSLTSPTRTQAATGEVTPYGMLAKMNGRDPRPDGKQTCRLDRHADAVAGCQWMQDQYEARTIDNGWIIFAHIERAGVFKTGSSDGGYNIEHFRDFNNAAPDVCYGFEGAPGHQVNNFRGLGNAVTCVDGSALPVTSAVPTAASGYYTAKVGGLWDALLGEGRRWFNYANSDYHSTGPLDIQPTSVATTSYPGEYQKTYVYAMDKDRDRKYSLNEIADGLRSGNAYFVHGDLINHLEFTAQSRFQKGLHGR